MTYQIADVLNLLRNRLDGEFCDGVTAFADVRAESGNTVVITLIDLPSDRTDTPAREEFRVTVDRL